MPHSAEINSDGRTYFEIPLRRELALSAECKTRAPKTRVKLIESSARKSGLPVLKTISGKAAGSGSKTGWRPVKEFPNTQCCVSDDERLEALATYKEDQRLGLIFRADEICRGAAVWWAIGTGDRLEREGTERLSQAAGKKCFTRAIDINLPFDRELYFELAEAQKTTSKQIT